MAFIHNHTTGDWNVQTGMTSYGKYKGYVILKEVESEEEDFSNALLISQAPKLLEFVETFHDHLETHHEDSMLLGMIKETLKKAGVQIKENG